MLAVDLTIMIYPRQSQEASSQPPIWHNLSVFYLTITNSMIIQHGTYTSAWVYHNSIVGQMGPWLRETHQGIWPRQLSLADQIECLGWQPLPAPLQHTRNNGMPTTSTTRTAPNTKLAAWTLPHPATTADNQEHQLANEVGTNARWQPAKEPMAKANKDKCHLMSKENCSTQKATGYTINHFKQQHNLDLLPQGKQLQESHQLPNNC